MKGFKAVNMDYRPIKDKSIAYQVGRTYDVEGDIRPCIWGLHFCPVLLNVYEYYPAAYCTRVLRVTALGQVLVQCGKCVTNELCIDDEMSPDEIVGELVKGAATCSGHYLYMTAMNALMRSLMYSDSPKDEETWQLKFRWTLAMQAHASDVIVQTAAAVTGYDLREVRRPAGAGAVCDLNSHSVNHE